MSLKVKYEKASEHNYLLPKDRLIQNTLFTSTVLLHFMYFLHTKRYSAACSYSIPSMTRYIYLSITIISREFLHTRETMRSARRTRKEKPASARMREPSPKTDNTYKLTLGNSQFPIYPVDLMFN